MKPTTREEAVVQVEHEHAWPWKLPTREAGVGAQLEHTHAWPWSSLTLAAETAGAQLEQAQAWPWLPHAVKLVVPASVKKRGDTAAERAAAVGAAEAEVATGAAVNCFTTPQPWHTRRAETERIVEACSSGKSKLCKLDFFKIY